MKRVITVALVLVLVFSLSVTAFAKDSPTGKKYYGILKENVYYVNKNRDKTSVLLKIKEKYPQLNSKKIVMIDDTVDILNEIMEKTDFSTAHISSFLDI